MFAELGNLATLACGLPYAMLAAAAFPDRQVVGFRWRRRAHDADGRARHLREICAEREGRSDQEKLPRRRFLYLSWHCHSSGRVPDSKVIG